VNERSVDAVRVAIARDPRSFESLARTDARWKRPAVRAVDARERVAACVLPEWTGRSPAEVVRDAHDEVRRRKICWRRFEANLLWSESEEGRVVLFGRMTRLTDERERGIARAGWRREHAREGDTSQTPRQHTIRMAGDASMRRAFWT